MEWNKSKVEELAEVISKYNLAEIEIQNGACRITVKKVSPSVQLLSEYQSVPASGLQQRITTDFRRITEKKTQQDEFENAKVVQKEKAQSGFDVDTYDGQKYLTAPIAGIFYRQSQPENLPYVEVGQRVRKGDTVCLVEAMKMINEVSANRDGVVKEFLAENEQFVEFGAPLVLIEEE